MSLSQYELSFKTAGRGLLEVTNDINDLITQSNVTKGLCNVFLHHTSASLIVCENADAQVLLDLQAFMQRLVPDGDPLFKHTQEGPDDMPAHVRMVLTQASLMIPVSDKQLALGKWQGVFLWEHRFDSHVRRMTVSIF